MLLPFFPFFSLPESLIMLYVWNCAVPSILQLCLLEGTWRWRLKVTEMLLRFVYLKKRKNWRQVNVENKWRWWRRTKNEEVVIKGSRIALAAVSPYYQCKVFMQILCRCVSGLWSSKSGTLEHMPALECNLERLSCLRQREKGGVGRREEHEGEGGKKLDRLVHFSFNWCPLSLLALSSVSLSLSLRSLVGVDRCLFQHNSCRTCRRMASVSPSFLILPNRQACLFMLPDIGRHLNGPARRGTMRQDETNCWKWGQRCPWHLSLSHSEDMCRAQVRL